MFETPFRPMRATLSGRGERVYMKLLVDGASDRVVGAHIFGPEAGEMAQLVAIALRMRRDEERFRRDHGAASDDGRGTRDDARAGAAARPQA